MAYFEASDIETSQPPRRTPASSKVLIYWLEDYKLQANIVKHVKKFNAT